VERESSNGIVEGERKMAEKWAKEIVGKKGWEGFFGIGRS
jgi:hypothetical protein